MRIHNIKNGFMNRAVLIISASLGSCGGGSDSSFAPIGSGRGFSGSAQSTQCVGRNFYTGLPTVAVEQSQAVTVGNSYAITYFDPISGIPVITYGPRFYQLHPLLQVFSKFHECQHANGIVSEVAANCRALIQMRNLGLSREEENIIAQWHIAEGVIGAQYGGTGAALWSETVQCAGTR
jgi:hypothetical protein